MTVTIQFGEPYDVTPGGHDGTKVAFPFTVTRPGSGAKRDVTTQHRVIVDISGTRSTIWGFGRNPNAVAEMAPTLFEYARPAVFDALVDETLKEGESIRTSVNAEGEYPFDPAKLMEPNGATYEVDLEEAQRRRQGSRKGSIGFNLPRGDA